jgi:hypothetical protein
VSQVYFVFVFVFVLLGLLGVGLLAVGPRRLRAWLVASARFLCVIASHKRGVWRFGRALGVSRWKLAAHDAAKLLPAEFSRYVGGLYLCDGDGSGTSGGTRRAWLAEAFAHHCARCTHHHEHFVRGVAAAPMPEQDVREMVADWCAAALEYGTGSRDGAGPGAAGAAAAAAAAAGGNGRSVATFVLGAAWFESRVASMVMHPLTVQRVISVLQEGSIRCEPRVEELFVAKAAAAAAATTAGRGGPVQFT